MFVLTFFCCTINIVWSSCNINVECWCLPKFVATFHVWLSSLLQNMLAACKYSRCICCGQYLQRPIHNDDVDADEVWKTIQKRIKFDNHMQSHHPDRLWTPVSLAMIRDVNAKRELAQMLDADPEVQLNGSPFNSLPGDPTSIADGPWSAKIRKVMKRGKACVEFWERVTNQLLFVKHRDADTMWSLLIRYTFNGLAAVQGAA